MIELSLPLNAVWQATGPSVLRARHVAAWGKTEVFVRNEAAYDISNQRAWSHQSPWALRMQLQHRLPYGLRVESYRSAPYGDMRQHKVRRTAVYGDMTAHRIQHRAPYWLTYPMAVKHSTDYAIATTDPVRAKVKTGYSILEDQNLQAVQNTPELVWNGQTVKIIAATLSADEFSPVWISSIDIADIGVYSGIAIGDAITVALGAESFVLVVDGKALSRDSADASRRFTITAVSPLALKDAPFAGGMSYAVADAIQAKDAVEAVLGHAVDWQLPGWVIPAGRISFNNVTPLRAALSIVQAIGGMLESSPDGTVVCRKRHPVSVPDYSGVAVAHQLFDSDVITATSRIAPARGFNRVTVANQDQAGVASSDVVEFVADAADKTIGTVRAYPSPARPVVLVHTGNPQTAITALGTRTRTETETVEFIAGRASLRYPAAAIVSTAWQHADLGAVTASGKELTAAVPGYSLLNISYTVESEDFDVSLATAEEVQFVLMDA